MGSISVTDDILTEFRRKSSLIKDVTGSLSLEQNDPMEFPRNRLILLDRVLGEIYLKCMHRLIRIQWVHSELVNVAH